MRWSHTEQEYEASTTRYTYGLTAISPDTLVFEDFKIDDSTYLEIEDNMTDTTDQRIDLV